MRRPSELDRGVFLLANIPLFAGPLLRPNQHNVFDPTSLRGYSERPLILLIRLMRAEKPSLAAGRCLSPLLVRRPCEWRTSQPEWLSVPSPPAALMSRSWIPMAWRLGSIRVIPSRESMTLCHGSRRRQSRRSHCWIQRRHWRARPE